MKPTVYLAAFATVLITALFFYGGHSYCKAGADELTILKLHREI